MKARRKLTKKQAALARERVKDPDATEAELALRAGYSDRQAAHDALQGAKVKARITDLMDKHPNLTDEGIAAKLSKMQDAKAIQFFQKDGMVTDEREYDDNGIQMAALHLAAELKGHKQKKLDVTSNGNTIKSLLLDDGEEA